MTTSKRSGRAKKKVRVLKLKKETLRDLNVKGKGKEVKGGGSGGQAVPAT